jgi:hypothetical protein
MDSTRKPALPVPLPYFILDLAGTALLGWGLTELIIPDGWLLAGFESRRAIAALVIALGVAASVPFIVQLARRGKSRSSGNLDDPHA